MHRSDVFNSEIRHWVSALKRAWKENRLYSLVVEKAEDGASTRELLTHTSDRGCLTEKAMFATIMLATITRASTKYWFRICWSYLYIK